MTSDEFSWYIIKDASGTLFIDRSNHLLDGDTLLGEYANLENAKVAFDLFWKMGLSFEENDTSDKLI